MSTDITSHARLRKGEGPKGKHSGSIHCARSMWATVVAPEVAPDAGSGVRTKK